MKKIVIVLSVIVLASCSSKLMMPTQSDADRVAKKYPGLTVSQLTEARDLYKQKCTQCHAAKNPTSKSEEKWRQIVPKMAAKAKNKGKEEISTADQETILKYLIAMSSR